MLVAAYLVGGFLIASVYAAGMLRGRRDRYHRLGFIIAFTVAAIATPIQMLVGDQLARWVYNNEPTKFAAIELVPKTASDVPETLFGHLNDDGTVSGGIAIPGLASILSDPSDGTTHGDRGSRLVPRRARGRRPARSTPCTSRGTSWSGSARCCSLLAAWYGAVVAVPRRHPEEQVVPACRRGQRVSLSVLAMEAGWVVTEVGRQPWIVFDYMKVTQAATDERRRLDHVPRDRRALHRRRRDARADPARDESRASASAAVTAATTPTVPTARASRSGRATASSRRWRAR